MKNKRFYAIVLLAALAFLQVHVAFAACVMAALSAAGSLAACCDGHEPTAKASQPVESAAPPCAIEDCIQSDAVQVDQRALLNTQLPDFDPAPAPAGFSGPFEAPLRVSMTPAHPAHTSLIYVLQRLLI